ncbi:F0F1 ATP synthase subunit B [Sulfurimonas sp. MAG313]|nr:F0F1 ATP synthase subunit B [Sulfurimonas sp. MAG313]
MTLMAVLALAAEHPAAAEVESDIVQRTVNFLIFAGIVYYLIAEPVKAFFTGRTQGIADELEKVQDRLKESKAAKEAANATIDDAKVLAEEIMNSCKKENVIINEKMASQLTFDLNNLEKQQDDLMGLEKRQMVRDLVENVLSDALTQDDSVLDKNVFADIILKKVA